MSSYTITITPDDASNASATLRVTLGASGARIKELTVRAGDGEGFAPEDLPGFELSRLIGAIAPAAGRPVIEAPAAALAAGGPAVDMVHARAQEAAAATRPAKKGAKVAAKKAGGAARAAATKTAAKAAKAAKGGQRASRAYRRMPEDIIAVYRQAGGATALAAHYGVPRHTAQGWLRRLRQQGDIPS